MRTICRVAFIALCVLLVSCTEKKTQEKLPVRVKTQTIQTLDLPENISFTGTVEANNETSLSFAMGGTVESINVSVGQHVAKGALIARVNSSTTTNSHAAAMSTLKQAEDAYKRMKMLHDNGSLPDIEWVNIQSKLQQAQSAEKIARKAVSDCAVYAPCSGTISEKLVEVGQNVLPGVPVAKIATINEVKVNISVPESEISKISKGANATISVAALNNKSFTGKVVEKGVTANILSHTYDVKISVNNANEELMPGMVTKAAISKGTTSTSVILPNNVVMLGNDNVTYVWLNVKGKAERRNVTCGPQTANGVTIIAGLSANDEVITEGYQKVSSGMNIEIVKQ